MKRFFEGLSPTLHIAHRGGAKLAPENTLRAFREAVETWRTDMLELDVSITRDGELVVSHDLSVDRCTNGTGLIAELTFAELSQLDAGGGERIPSLREVLRAFPSVRINIELKAGGFEREFAALVRAERAQDRVCCGSESDEVAGKLFDALPDACHFYPREALTALVMSVRAGEDPPRDDRFDVLDMPLSYQGVRLFDAELRNTCAVLHKWINVWTIDDEAEMRALVAERVGGIMTDRPDLLRRVLGG
jgi:glycerophosphoryl diester phosphodiesterase